MIVSDAYLCCLCAILSIHVALSHRAKPHKNWIFIISPSLHILPTTSSNDIDIIGSEMNFNVQLTGCLAFIAIPFCICSISAFIAGTFCYWMVEKFISEGRESEKKRFIYSLSAVCCEISFSMLANVQWSFLKRWKHWILMFQKLLYMFLRRLEWFFDAFKSVEAARFVRLKFK